VRRTATVRAMTHCYLLVLTHASVLRAEDTFPEIADRIKDKLREVVGGLLAPASRPQDTGAGPQSPIAVGSV
jgi:hypothetical protein